MLSNDLVGPTGDMLDGGALPLVNPHPQGATLKVVGLTSDSKWWG